MLPSIGLVGNVTENAAVVVLHLTRSFTDATYPLLVIIVVALIPVPSGVSKILQLLLTSLYTNAMYEPSMSRTNDVVSSSIFLDPAASIVKLLSANFLCVSITPIISPSTGALGNVIENAPLVVLHLTRSFALAI